MTTFAASIDAQICDHMVMELNQSGFIDTLRAKAETDLSSMSGPYGTVTRTYLPEYDHDYPQKYRVSIFPTSMSQSWASRVQMFESFTVNTIVLQRLDVGDNRKAVTIEGDKLMKLADQIRKWFEWGTQNAAQVIDGTDECICARWIGCQRPTMFEPVQVNDYHMLFTLMTHTWILYREIGCGRPYSPEEI